MEIAIPIKLERRIDSFLTDPARVAQFIETLRGASVADVLHPARNPALFGRAFTDRIRSMRVVYPLLRHPDRIRFLGVKLEQAARGESTIAVHPASAYLHISTYQEQFRPLHEAAMARARQERAGAKKKTSKKSAKSKSKAPARRSTTPPLRLTAAQQRELEGSELFRSLEKLKKLLRVPPAFSRARNLEELRELVMSEFEVLVSDYVGLDAELGALRAEVETYRNPEYMHPEVRRTLDEIVAENTRQKIHLQRETRRASVLEEETHRLAEQILSAPSQGPATTEEIETLRRDLAVVSEKYDALVSKNIELVNRLQRTEGKPSLEQALDQVRDKINSVLRSNANSPDDVLLRRLQEELVQLIRARSYMGRALYDLGLLYLRLGKRKDAIRELRGARELGVEDPETNRLLNS